MNPFVRALCWLVLLAPAVAGAQTSFPRCTETRDPIVILGGNGCRENLPEPPPPTPTPPPPPPGEAAFVEPEATLAPPIWRDFDPSQVPGWSEQLVVGLDLRNTPSIYGDKVDPGKEESYTFLEVAIRSTSEISRSADYDVLRLRADNSNGQIGIAVEHWRRRGSTWSVLDQAKADLVDIGVRPMEEGPIVPHSAVLQVWTDSAGVHVDLNGTPILSSVLASPSARIVRVRRGIFGPNAITAGESIGLEWIEPNFRALSPPPADGSRGE